MPAGSASTFVNTMRESSKKTAGSSNESKVKIEEAIGSIMKNVESIREMLEQLALRSSQNIG